MKKVSKEEYGRVVREALANGAEDKPTEGTTICTMQTVQGTKVIAQAVYTQPVKGEKVTESYWVNDGEFRCKLPDEPRATWSAWLPMVDYQADPDCDYEFREAV